MAIYSYRKPASYEISLAPPRFLVMWVLVKSWKQPIGINYMWRFFVS